MKKSERKKNKKKKKIQRHHVIPRSRYNNKKVVRVPSNFHSAWHIVFENLYGMELLIFVYELSKQMETKHEISSEDIRNLRSEIKEYGYIL